MDMDEVNIHEFEDRIYVCECCGKEVSGRDCSMYNLGTGTGICRDCMLNFETKKSEVRHD